MILYFLVGGTITLFTFASIHYYNVAVKRFVNTPNELRIVKKQLKEEIKVAQGGRKVLMEKICDDIDDWIDEFGLKPENKILLDNKDE